MMVPAGEIASLKIWRSEVVETTLFLTLLEISGNTVLELFSTVAPGVVAQEIGRPVR
jgi:hypothetical protein